MTKQRERNNGQLDRDEALAAIALGTRSVADHLDENDFALWELNALSPAELDAVREHLFDCDSCRIRAAEFLKNASLSAGPEHNRSTVPDREDRSFDTLMARPGLPSSAQSS